MTAWEGLNPPYATVVADPPWSYRVTRMTARTGDHKNGAEDHYSTMTMEEIAALPVADLIAPDAHLYLWTTNPKMFGDRDRKRSGVGPIDVLEAWGFTYITLLTWHKIGALGMGFYFRGETEHVLFGIRGHAPIPVDLRERNWFEGPKTGHSVKPPIFLDLVESVSPGPYVELFARAPRLGWDAWGLGHESAPMRKRIERAAEL